MKYLSDVFYFKDISKELDIKVPNTCPHCHTIMRPWLIDCTKIDPITENTDKRKFAGIYLCTACDQYFVQPYVMSSGKYIEIAYHKKYLKSKLYDLPNEISEISENFKEIYMQSIEAESLGLNHLAGMGLRKALEFLVKDYLINFVGENDKEILKISLSQAINRIESRDLRALALVSTWLGNEETHYKSEVINKDIDDMKKFIRALANLITYEIAIKECHGIIDNQKVKNKK